MVSLDPTRSYVLSYITRYLRYSTGTDLNTYSALIQNFYSQETAPYQAVHVVLDTGVREGVKQGVKAYVRCAKSVIPSARVHTSISALL
jgi:hypothetical protein